MSYKPKVPAREAQKKALKKMRGKEAFALLMAMRTGKTKVALDDFGEMELAGEVQDQLVIAPGGAYKTWVPAIQAHSSEDLLDRMRVHVFESGAGVKALRAREHFITQLDPRRPRTLLMNVEALSRAGAGRDLAQEFVQQRQVVTVIDESTRIKNRSERSKFIIKRLSGPSDHRRILSGLAAPRSPLDLYYQFFFLDWRILGFRNYYTYRSWVAIMKTAWFGGRRVELVDTEKGNGGFRPEAIAEIQEKIEPYSFRVPFKPKYPSTYSFHEVALTKEQKKAYNEMRDFAITKLAKDKHVTATVVISQIIRLHQILCGHVQDDDGGPIHTFPENRTAALLEILEEYAGKAVIWCSYDIDVRKITDALENEYGSGSVARFWGGNTKTREKEEQAFLHSPNCRFMVSTPGSGGQGRTWTVADLVIYYSSTNNLEHREQSEQRVLGEDKSNPADFIDLKAEGFTVEDKIIEALRRKINMSTAISGDNYREWLI